MFLDIIKLLRPHQWIKNLFIFIPLFFAGKILKLYLLLNAFIAFIAFSLTASGIYVLNDLKDIKEDRKHPKKRFRPLASGKISKKIAFILIVLLLFFGLTLMFFLSKSAGLILAFYVLLNIFYSFYLKYVAIIDVVVIAIGFVLRLFIGAVVTGVVLSTWIVVITFLLALFLAFAKRRDDVIEFEKSEVKLRKVIDGYNLIFLDISMSIMASSVIVAYIFWTVEATSKFHSNYLYLTAFFVVLGILKYLQIAFVYQDSGSPTKVVLKNRFIQFVLIGWILTFIGFLYL